jgi:A/G-specific adenine glycosylase
VLVQVASTAGGLAAARASQGGNALGTWKFLLHDGSNFCGSFRHIFKPDIENIDTVRTAILLSLFSDHGQFIACLVRDHYRHVTRVFARVLNKPLGKRETQTIADSTVPVGLSWEWNQVLMDFGATCCAARSPKCEQCPIATSCGWHIQGGDDPAPASAGTSKPQARFVGSNRQARGKLMKALVAGGVSRNKAEHAMGLMQQPDRAEMIIESLLADHLITDVNGVLQLPL